MNFYASATGGAIISIQRYGDAPMPGNEAHKDKVLHGLMHINGATVMFSDSGSNGDVSIGNNFSMALDFKDEAQMQQAFDALCAGGAVTMPLQDTFWGARFGMCKDKFSINWMFNMDKPKV